MRGRDQGSDALRAELRHLRAMGLVRMNGGRRIGSIENGMKFDLADFVALREGGERWLSRIRQLRDEDARSRPPGAPAHEE